MPRIIKVLYLALIWVLYLTLFERCAIRFGVKYQQARREVAPTFNHITAIFMATPRPVGEASCLASLRFIPRIV
ncbi:hypothetical protein BGP78_06425 [Pseudoalteromonas sp. MSK9-3]|nr:hypothetical protein BGP78_06425 [Pseudoalteromonas sp. MSK9-3]